MLHFQANNSTCSYIPTLNNDILKQSGIGKGVMMLYRHPKDTRKNKEKAEKLIS